MYFNLVFRYLPWPNKLLLESLSGKLHGDDSSEMDLVRSCKLKKWQIFFLLNHLLAVVGFWKLVFGKFHTCARGGGKGGEVPPPEGGLSPTAIFNIPDQGCSSENFFLPALFPPLRIFFFSLPYSPISNFFFAPCPIPPLEKFFSPCPNPPSQNFFFTPCPIPPPENLTSPWPIPPSPEIIWPIPCPHHPSLPYPHPPPEFFLVRHAFPPP